MFEPRKRPNSAATVFTSVFRQDNFSERIFPLVSQRIFFTFPAMFTTTKIQCAVSNNVLVGYPKHNFI